jgi:hypothetical protein
VGARGAVGRVGAFAVLTCRPWQALVGTRDRANRRGHSLRESGFARRKNGPPLRAVATSMSVRDSVSYWVAPYGLREAPVLDVASARFLVTRDGVLRTILSANGGGDWHGHA